MLFGQHLGGWPHMRYGRHAGSNKVPAAAALDGFRQGHVHEKGAVLLSITFRLAR
jgi:hypothetical protein